MVYPINKASTIQGGAGFVPFRVFIHKHPARGRPLSSCGWIQQRGKPCWYGLGDFGGKTLAIPWNNVIGWVSYCINNYFGPFRQCLLPSWCFVKCWYLGLTIIHCRSQYFWRFVFSKLRICTIQPWEQTECALAAAFELDSVRLRCHWFQLWHRTDAPHTHTSRHSHRQSMFAPVNSCFTLFPLGQSVQKHPWWSSFEASRKLVRMR